MAKSTSAEIGLLLSGGLDSCILLGYLLKQGYAIRPFYLRSQLAWEEPEREAVERFSRAIVAQAAVSPRLSDLVSLELPLADLYVDHWSVTSRDVPRADTPDEAVYLPGRNPLLLIKAALWCQLHGIDELALAVLQSNPFSDATPEFFDRFGALLREATGKPIHIRQPFGRLDKRAVMELGRSMPLGLTFSCIAPQAGRHCGRCNKCAERRAAFEIIDLKDPTRYAADPQHVG